MKNLMATVVLLMITKGIDSVNVIKSAASSQSVLQGTSVTVPCKAHGLSKPIISWKVNGVKVENSDKYTVDAEIGSLTIDKVEIADEGRYDCAPDNNEEEKISTKMIVKRKTTITEGPKDQTVSVFSSVLMNCSVVADMTQNLTVMWKKNNEELGLVGFSKTDRIDRDENYGLRIKNATLADSGTYTCVARTILSEDSAQGDLSVEGIPPLLAQPNWPDDHIEGSNITLACPILQGYPRPDITWYKDGDNITAMHHSNTLHVPGARPEHSGDYTCVAHNNYGSDRLLLPVRVLAASHIVSPPLSYRLGEAGTIVFNCEAEVDQDLQQSLEVIWFRGEDRLDNTSAVLLHNSSLLIARPSQAHLGQYSCQLQTRLETGVRTLQGELLTYQPQLWPLIIILVLILAITILLLGICISCNRVGQYRVHRSKTAEEGSIISFSTPGKKPKLLTQIQMTQLAHMNSPVCSVGSLTSVDELLNSGMGEDGSFRGNYYS
jgi:hypothetical protein